MAKELMTIRISKSQKHLLEYMSDRYDTSIDGLIAEAIYEYYWKEREEQKREQRGKPKHTDCAWREPNEADT